MPSRTNQGPAGEARPCRTAHRPVRGQAAGFFKDRKLVEQEKKHPDLDALRPREDFGQLVAELEAAVKQ
jgi:hypothetical protein